MKKTYLSMALLFVLGVVITMFGGVDAGAISVAALLPPGIYGDAADAFKDPDRIKLWSQKYFYRTQSKTIFDESYTGTSISKDGPRKSDTIVGAPVILVTDLQSKSGMVVTYTMLNPLFDSAEARMRFARVKGQVREGSEKTSSKKFVQFPLASAFWGDKEEDVNVGKKEIGMVTLTAEMTRLLSDNVAQYMDDDAIESFFTGHSRHLFSTIAKARGTANNGAVVGSTDLGVPTSFAEHPNTLAWTTAGLINASAEAGATHEAKVHAALSKITSTALPSASLLNNISLEVKRRNMVGIQFIDKKFNRTLFKVIVDPITMLRFREDFQSDGSGFGNITSAAYMTTGDEHPLIKQGNIIWGNLLVCEEEKLFDENYSNKYSFGNAVVTNATTAPQVKRATDGDGIESVWIEKGTRTFVTGTPAFADDEIGAAGGVKIGNILVMGANALGRVPGPVYPLIPRTTDDYRRIVGLGAEHIFGHKRLDWTDAAGASPYNQSSLRIAVYRGS